MNKKYFMYWQSCDFLFEMHFFFLFLQNQNQNKKTVVCYQFWFQHILFDTSMFWITLYCELNQSIKVCMGFWWEINKKWFSTSLLHMLQLCRYSSFMVYPAISQNIIISNYVTVIILPHCNMWYPAESFENRILREIHSFFPIIICDIRFETIFVSF